MTRGFLALAAVISATIVVLILGFLLFEVREVPATIGMTAFFTDEAWYPTAGLFQIIPLAVGTLAVTAGAIVLAMPLSLFVATYLHLYAAPAWASLLRRALALLGGIPSVVFGFWGLTVLVPLIDSWQPPGASLLAATLVLALMILPTGALLVDAAFGAVPKELILGARALGTGDYGVWRLAMLPQARGGIGTATLLASGRALGETMAVLMVCGNIVQVPDSLFAPVRTMTANIALEMGYAEGPHRAALFVTGFALLLLVAGLVLVASRFGREPGVA